RPDIISDLDLIIKLCDIIEFIKEGYKEEVYRNLFKGDPFYMWIMSGLTSCYKDEEISKIDIKKYRRPYDQIANGKEVNLEELASAGKFFRIMHEKADQSLPFRYIPPLPKDFDRY
ncbi:MAG: hypothetical protein Q8N63_06420, partial [Nanoarchaeota archaeon]|nr:hypothetical protein [Nanoarchaeota archaeon]